MLKYGTKTSNDAKLEQSTVLKIVSQEYLQQNYVKPYKICNIVQTNYNITATT